MTKKTEFFILDGDGEELFDAMSEHFKTKVVSICGNQIHKVEIETGEGETSDYFNGGVYCEKADAQREVKRLYRTIQQFRQGKCGKVNAFAFKPSDVSTLELLNLYEIYGELNTANKISAARMTATIDCVDEVENFLDKLRLETLMKGRCLT